MITTRFYFQDIDSFNAGVRYSSEDNNESATFIRGPANEINHIFNDEKRVSYNRAQRYIRAFLAGTTKLGVDVSTPQGKTAGADVSIIETVLLPQDPVLGCGCMEGLVFHELARIVKCGANEACARYRKEVFSMLKSLASYLFIMLCALTVGAAEQRPQSLALRLDVDRSQTSLDRIRVRVLLENDGSGCVAQVVDTYWSPFDLPSRGEALLTLDVQDANGRTVAPTAMYPPTVMAVTVDDLLVLDCGEVFGRYITFDRSFWQYELRPGRYTVRATMILDTLRAVPEGESREHLAKRLGIAVSRVPRALPVTVLHSSPVSVVISRDGSKK